MSFYQNMNIEKNNIWEISPITWGDFKIVGFKELRSYSDPVAACYHKMQSQAWYDLALGILTNNMQLVKENIDKVNILKVLPVVTNDPNKVVKLFSVKEAKKYSSAEIQNLIREKYNRASLNAKWAKQEKTRTSRGSYFTTVPSFDDVQLAKVKPNDFEPLANPITISQVRIVGVSHNNYRQTSLNHEYYAKLNLNLLCAVMSGNFGMVQSIVESDFNSICTMPSFITENLNELHVDLPFEALQLGFTQIAQYLENVQNAQNQSCTPCFIRAESTREITLGTFVKADTKMETEN